MVEDHDFEALLIVFQIVVVSYLYLLSIKQMNHLDKSCFSLVLLVVLYERMFPLRVSPGCID